MKTLTAERAYLEFYGLLHAAARQHQQYRIASIEGGVVLLSEEDYENLIETLELLSTPGMRASLHAADAEIEAGETYSLDEVFGEE